mmetsp:Transcript_14659/g.20726  ORF Transcript_14659/g.20726 Transcript_14659/m.20726 type:complete len:370 (+) Transcript_14659:197-1306(+)
MFLRIDTYVVTLLLATAPLATSAFQVSYNSISKSGLSEFKSSNFPIWAKKVKRGKLANNVVPGGASISKPKETRKRTSGGGGKNSGKEGGVSPALAEWVSSQQGDDVTAEVGEPSTLSQVIESVSEDDAKNEFKPFKDEKQKGKNARRVKQAARQAEDEKRSAMVQSILEGLEEMLAEKSGATLDDIIGQVHNLISVPGDNSLKSLTAGAKPYSYRLAWVGSDDAICHVGTGLHKVPLARLQEIFMTCKGRNRVELLEVIRILGPFPNVRNTLQGDSIVRSSSGDVTDWKITYDSMIDGTGKEILAGEDDNVRMFNLQVYFSSEEAIVAVVPPESPGIRSDPLEANGSNVLVFVREDDLDGALQKLRVD